ncbi:DUF4365 domain-containing protein [Martelella lutilitoris]|uniref:DUF4365 domain-containing protein n=1 Tax=Martelella lutilitoris TaxID=2583532 RepID=A0A5C4JSI3_9HYPH|nr:DUF4365 domain-containing protein [Martelella lutilitoris]TNB48190.1 DUF4365 domain-containing protein [Martelella lutilitoris]
MSQRTRSHRLEDISIVEFQRLLPDEWVCRTKDKDYGVDLEVEIFDEDGRSTGLIFYVQMKATDKKGQERSVRMKIDRLSYLSSLDAPSIIVRYCAATRTTHFIWIHNVFDQIGPTSSASATVRFSEADTWSDETPLKVLRTIKILRTIRLGTRNLPLGLTVEDGGTTSSSVFELKLAASRLQRMSQMIGTSNDPDRCLPIAIHLKDNYLVASIDAIASINWHIDEFSSEKILPILTYILAYMTGRYEFHRQSSELIRIIHANQFTANNRIIAGRIAQLAINNPDTAADIARWNRIHAIQDEAYLTYLNALLSSEIPMVKREAAVTAFYTDAISDHDPTNNQNLSTICYSLANFQMNNGRLGEAVSNYNRARKLDEIYLQRTYFLNEVGACCFWSRHFRSASLFYSASYNLSPNPQVGICTGDALLYSGDFIGAKSKFEDVAARAPDELNGAEALTKAWLSSWLHDFYQRNNLVGTECISDRSTWISEIDRAQSTGEYPNALGAALMEAFLCDDDISLWAAAMSFALKTKNSQLILGTFSCAIWRNGYEVYASFRRHLERVALPEEDLAYFDQYATTLYEMRPAEKFQNVTKRLVSKNNFDCVVEINPNENIN